MVITVRLNSGADSRTQGDEEVAVGDYADDFHSSLSSLPALTGEFDLLISPNCIFDASLAPETWPSC